MKKSGRKDPTHREVKGARSVQPAVETLWAGLRRGRGQARAQSPKAGTVKCLAVSPSDLCLWLSRTDSQGVGTRKLPASLPQNKAWRLWRCNMGRGLCVLYAGEYGL